MSFYFALYQILETMDRLAHDLKSVAGRALRISPRDARANREILESAGERLRDVRKVLSDKPHISKIALRKASLLHQLVELSYRRLLYLNAAVSHVGPDDEGAVKTLWQLVAGAQLQFRDLARTLSEHTGLSVAVVLDGTEEMPSGGFAAILKRDLAFQSAIVKQIEKAAEVFGEEVSLVEHLGKVRMRLLDSRRQTKARASGAEHRENGSASAVEVSKN